MLFDKKYVVSNMGSFNNMGRIDLDVDSYIGFIKRDMVYKLLDGLDKNDFNNLGINYKDSISRIERNFNRINNEEISVIVSLGENSEVKQYLIKN